MDNILKSVICSNFCIIQLDSDVCWIFSSFVVMNSLYLLLIYLNLVEYY